MFKKNILIIDDSKAFCDSVIDLIEDETDWSIDKVLDGESAVQLLKETEYQVVLLDLKMPGMSGLDVLIKLEELNLINRNYIIVLTGEITIENAVYSLQYGARDFIQKTSVVEHHENFLSRIEKGFFWQKERLVNEKLRNEKRKAIEESQLIVKSVGHDMSGSYYGSLMLRLQMLSKKIERTKEIVSQNIKKKITAQKNEDSMNDILHDISNVEELIENSLERAEGIISLMKFFKELGEKLKHLGNAISIDRSHEQMIDLSSILKSAFHILSESKINENPDVKIIEDYYPDPLIIKASEEDLLRVFLNLIENAYKAMNHVGTLTLKTYKKDNFAYASVKDSGCGIPADTLDQIWRPDYSSWENATGTGLGLMICKKAVENSGGYISVNSVVNEGTEFILKFPFHTND